MLNVFSIENFTANPLQTNVIYVLLCLSGSKWHLHRKLITPSFHFKILEQFFEVFVVKSNSFVNKLRQLPVDKVVDLMPLISKCTLDIICGKNYLLNKKIQRA